MVIGFPHLIGGLMPRGKKKDKKIIEINLPKEETTDLYVYVGGMPRINIKGVLYEYGVPSYIPKHIYKDLNSKDFIPYNPEIKTYRNSSDPIAVYMPMEVHYFICAIPTLHRIKKCFPKCEIVVFGRPELKEYLPSFARYQKNRTGRERFYRTFDLRYSYLKKYWLTAATESIEPIHQLMLKSTGLYNESTDRDGIQVVKTDKPKEKGEAIILYKDESEFSQLVAKSFDFTSINPYDSDPHARGVIFTYDSPLVYYYLYMQVPVLVFIDDNKYKHKIQYKAYDPTCVFQAPLPEDFDAAISIIGDMLKQDAKRALTRKELDEVSEHYEEPTTDRTGIDFEDGD
jgi:hypothetical protein